jgi:hypothetical protein
MRDTYYFSHDYNARTDSKIKRLIARHGLMGYGIYWAIVEDLYQNANALPTDYEGIAFDIRSDAETVKSIVNDFDLFKVEADLFGSLSVQRRLDEREQKSTKARDSARKRWDKDANALPTQSDRNAIKGKERKGKEKKVVRKEGKNERKKASNRHVSFAGPPRGGLHRKLSVGRLREGSYRPGTLHGA